MRVTPAVADPKAPSTAERSELSDGLEETGYLGVLSSIIESRIRPIGIAPRRVIDGRGSAERVRRGPPGMKRRIGDRRAKSRFEDRWRLMGQPRCQCDAGGPEFRYGGALLESSVPLVPDSVHWVSAVIDGHSQPLRLRVRHSTRNSASPDARYLTGVEFLTVTAATSAFIARHVNTIHISPAEAG